MQQDEYVEILNNESGYVITEAKERDGLLVVRGLRDPLAKTPQAMLERSSLVSDDVIHKFEPYQSLQADFVAKRVMAILDPPQTVSIEIVEQVLVVKGSASKSWRSRLITLAPLIGGITGYDDSALTDNFVPAMLDIPDSVDFVPAMLDIPDSVDARFEAGVLYLQGRAEQEWIARLTDHVANYDELQRVDTSALINATEEALIAEIDALEDEVIYFDVATFSNIDQMDGARITSLVQKIIDLSNKLDRSVLIFVKGYSDSVGIFEDNVVLSLDRADYVAQVIYLAGISPKYIEVKGLEAPVAVEANDTERRQNRRVNFQVTIE